MTSKELFAIIHIGSMIVFFLSSYISHCHAKKKAQQESEEQESLARAKKELELAIRSAVPVIRTKIID